jgi:two-component system response regulator QseB
MEMRMTTPKVLLIEDDAMNRLVLRDMFAVAGLQIDEASGAAEGLRLIDHHSYDLLLVDLRMPGIDGFSVMEAVRSRSDEKCTTPIIVVSGETGPDLRSNCMKAGASDLITKPVAMQALFESIGAVFAKRTNPETSFY